MRECTTIQDQWSSKLRQQALERSSLKFIDLAIIPYNHPHPVWPEDTSPYNIIASSYRAKMLTGGYILQSNRAKYNQHEVSPKCQLCGHETEDMVHFICDCQKLQKIRDSIISEKIAPIAAKLGISIPCSSSTRCRFILNGGAGQCVNGLSKPDYVNNPKCASSTRVFQKLQIACSVLCYKLHLIHNELLFNQH